MGKAKLEQHMEEFESHRWMPEEQALAKARSRLCGEAFDLHIYPISSRDPKTFERHYLLAVASVDPRSTGSVRLSSADADAVAIIDHGYLTDPDDYDREVLIDGIKLAREILGELTTSGWIKGEMTPGPGVSSDVGLAEFVEQSVNTYFHPASTCKMGPANDPMAVVDTAGKVHGLDNLYVCDASIFPVIMRANTNLPTVMLAEHLAGAIASIL